MTLRTRAVAAAAALPLALGLLPAGAVQAAAPGPETPGAGVESVLVISVDGLNPDAVRRLGPERAPTLHRLAREGVSTDNARTSFESTSTLPNHTGMVTGRRVRAAAGGHGVTWNDQRLTPATVHLSAGERVESVFSVTAADGGSPALFASKPKFTLFGRSWGEDLARSVILQDNRRLVRQLRRDLRTQERSLRFVHLSLPDAVGHESGYMGGRYVRAVAQVDAMLATVLRTVEGDPELSGETALLVTSDHGGARAKVHDDARRLVNYRVPFYAYGPGIAAGADLYDLNPAYADPGESRPAYAVAGQPIRNIAVGNLALDLLGLSAIPGSTVNADQDLEVAP